MSPGSGEELDDELERAGDDPAESAGFGTVEVPDGAAGLAADEPAFLSGGPEHPSTMASTPPRIEADQRNDREKSNRIGCLLPKKRLRRNLFRMASAAAIVNWESDRPGAETAFSFPCCQKERFVRKNCPRLDGCCSRNRSPRLRFRLRWPGLPVWSALGIMFEGGRQGNA